MVGGHFSEWFRDIRVFKNKKFDESGEIRPECNTYWPNPKKYIFSINSLEELLNKKMVCTVNRCPCLNFIYNSLNDND